MTLDTYSRRTLALTAEVAAMGTITAGHTRTLLASGMSLPSTLTSADAVGFVVAVGCVAAGLVITVLAVRR